MTIPNLISVFRILLVPIFLVFIINERFPAGLVVFVLAGLSDGADGMVARLFNQKSRLGSYLDPLADKCLLVSAFICPRSHTHYTGMAHRPCHHPGYFNSARRPSSFS